MKKCCIANSCQIKGLSTFIVNLFRTGLRVVTPLKGHWMFQYMHGLRQEVFPIILPATFHEEGLTFEQVSHFLQNSMPTQKNLNFLSKFSALKLV
jgi:potassium large conductance calcium-activated channel subfamily M alpha protein 1